VGGARERNRLYERELLKLGDRDPLAIPDTVRAAIRAHLGRLPAPARALADAASVLGSEPSRALLPALAGVDERAAAHELAVLVDHGVLIERGAHLGFAHALFAETLPHDLDPARREALHEGAAGLLAQVPGAPAAEITRHLFAAGPACVADAIAAARRAAADAARQLAFDEAAALLER